MGLTSEQVPQSPRALVTKADVASAALGAHWFVKTVSVEDAADNRGIPAGQVHIDAWGPRWWPFRVPNRVLSRVSDVLAPNLPINIYLIVEDGRP